MNGRLELVRKSLEIVGNRSGFVISGDLDEIPNRNLIHFGKFWEWIVLFYL